MSSRLEDPAGTVDRLLVERHRSGDAAAFAELYERHYPRLVRFVHRRIAQRHVAEDMAQEAFARALAAVDTLRDPSRFYPWLTVIARHLVVGHHRAAARVCLIADMDGGVGEDDAPDSRLLRQVDEEDVQKALARVRRRHREILELREHDELSYEDIAVRLGTPTTTVPPLLFRARQALRREYLAVVEGEDKRLPVLVPAMLAGIRRVRARAAQYAGWLPDANAWCASAACIALTVGGLVGPIFGGGGFDAVASPGADDATVASSDGQAAATVAPSSAMSAADRPGAAETASPRIAGPNAAVPGVAEAGINNPEGAHRMRDQSREMPIYHEIGPAGFAADPDQFRHDMESTLAGNPEWLEGS